MGLDDSLHTAQAAVLTRIELIVRPSGAAGLVGKRRGGGNEGAEHGTRYEGSASTDPTISWNLIMKNPLAHAQIARHRPSR